MHHIIVELPLPPSLNNAYINNPRTGGRFPSNELKRFKADAIPLIRVIARQFDFTPQRHRLHVALTFHFATRQSHSRSDIDNRAKPTLDALATALEFNDNQVDRLELVRGGFDGRSRAIALIEIVQQ